MTPMTQPREDPMTTASPDWIAVACGAADLSVWLMGANDTVLEHRHRECGVTPDRFEATLREMLSDMLDDAALPVIVSGIAHPAPSGSPPPYVATPCRPPDIAQAVQHRIPGAHLHFLPGVKQATPADLMQGEETRVAGFLSRDPAFDGILCLPGPHTTWVHISAGEIVSFRTFMTGEMFDLLGQHSVLHDTVHTDDWDQAAFDAGLAETLSRPTDLAAKLFSLRAAGLLNGLPPATARARLLALLVGAELAAAKPYWLGQDVVISGETRLASAYSAALSAQGAAVRSVDAAGLALAGLITAYHRRIGP